jgi:hypothetical protein
MLILKETFGMAIEPSNAASAIGLNSKVAMFPEPNDIGTICSDKVSDECWYVGQTQPRAESCAVADLARQSYSVFFSRYRLTVCHARQAKNILAPFFPNYLFLRLGSSRDFFRAVDALGLLRALLELLRRFVYAALGCEALITAA